MKKIIGRSGLSLKILEICLKYKVEIAFKFGRKHLRIERCNLKECLDRRRQGEQKETEEITEVKRQEVRLAVRGSLEA